MHQEYNKIFDEGSTTVTVRERLNQYLSYWPLFLVCIFLCVGAGIVYNRYIIPKYITTTSFLVKEGTPKSADLIESALNGKREINLNNEMLLVSSASLMQRTVANNKFNISYLKKGRVLNIDIYKDAPFKLVVKHITDSNRSYSIYINRIDMFGGYYYEGVEKGEKLYVFTWNKPFVVNGQVFVLEPKRRIEAENMEFIVRWQSVGAAAAEISSNFNVKTYDTKTSVIQLFLKTENIEKGKDVLNGLLAEFNSSDMEDQNKLSERTVQFIDDRLLKISEELKGVEGNLENFQGSRELIDIKGQSSQSLENSNIVIGSIKDLNVQQGIASMILDYFTHPVTGGKLVPSSLGLDDATLTSLITQYNELQLKKERETPLVAPNSTVMQDIDTQLENLKGSILESLRNVNKNLRLRENSFQQQNRQTRSFLSSIPHNERVLQEIKRKQSITEGLYLYLLQKREEQAISSTASNVAHYKQIDPASGYGPVEPNSKSIFLYTFLLGLFLPFGYIYLRDNLLNDKITNREDITSKVALPLIGQITHIPKKRKQVISVLGRSMTGEEFRSIRTKLSFILNNSNKKVILVTSSLSNEGKSFVSLNLAAICAIPGKKVALLEFDIRKPTIAASLGVSSFTGLFNFLSGEVSKISDMSCITAEIPTLHIYPSGSGDLNPADLLISDKVKKLFEALNEAYDYIIIDSPPIDYVSDAFILEQYCNMVLYIVRQGTTYKKQMEIINDTKESGSLRNIHLILNDVRSRTQSYYYENYDNYTHNKPTHVKKFFYK